MEFTKKRIIAIGAVSICIIGIAASIFVRPANAQQAEPRLREFPAKIGTITVGIDGTGTITSNKKHQLSDVGVKLEEYTVKKGDYVKSGETIARLMKSDIEKKLQAAEQELKSLQSEINKAKDSKESFINDADGKLAQTRGSAQASYNEKASPLNAKIITLTEQIDQKSTQITKLEEDISLYEAEKSQSKPDAPDYDAMIKSVKDEISRLVSEKELLNAEIIAANAQLAAADEELKRLHGKENTSVENQKNQNLKQLSQHDEAIKSANEKYANAFEKTKALKNLLASPEIKSEREGVVLGLGFDAGAEINSSASLIDIGSKEDLFIELYVDAVDFTDVSEGQEVSFYVDAYPDSTFTGSVKSKNYIQNENGKFAITVSVNESEQELYNGMGVSATLIIKQKKDVITLQNKAIINENAKQYINVITQDGAFEKREIKTGFSDGKVTEILSGIAAGETAVIEEQYENS